MTPSRHKIAIWPALVLLMICFSLPANCQNVIALVGSGSNVPTPLYSHWIDEYNKLSPTVQVRYLSTGTMKGIEDISRGVGDFAAGEVPMSDEQLKAAKTPILQIPTVLVAIVPIYHVPGVKGSLRFSGPVLAEIFLGNIKTWDDPRIKEINAGQPLPHLDIAVVHRTEGKGSNYILTDFLSKTSQKWRSQIGKTPSPAWPVGASANRGEDMMEKVKSTPGAMGYIELGFTLTDNSVGVGLVQNVAGRFISADSGEHCRCLPLPRKVHSGGSPRFAYQRSGQRGIPDSKLYLALMCLKDQPILNDLRRSPITSSGCLPRVSKAPRNTGTRRCPRHLPLKFWQKRGHCAERVRGFLAGQDFKPAQELFPCLHRRLSFL